MNALYQHCATDNFILDVAKFSPAAPIILLVSCKLSFMTVGFKMYFLPHFKLEHPIQFFIMYFTEFITYLLWLLTDTLLCINTFIPSWGICIQNKNITPASFERCILHPFAKKLYSLNC